MEDQAISMQCPPPSTPTFMLWYKYFAHDALNSHDSLNQFPRPASTQIPVVLQLVPDSPNGSCAVLLIYVSLLIHQRPNLIRFLLMQQPKGLAVNLIICLMLAQQMFVVFVNRNFYLSCCHAR